MDSSSSFIPEHRQALIVSTKGVHFEILCQSFSDRHLVIVTCNGKVGTFIQAWYEDTLSGGKTFQTNAILGRREDPLLSGTVRQQLYPQSM